MWRGAVAEQVVGGQEPHDANPATMNITASKMASYFNVITWPNMIAAGTFRP